MQNTEDKKEKRMRIILIVLCILTFVAMLTGATFAFFSVTVKGNNTASSVILKTASLGIEYDAGDAIIVEDFRPGYTAKKTFTINNTGDASMVYDIRWVSVSNNFANKNDLRYDVVGTVKSGTGAAQNATNIVMPSSDTNMLSSVTIDAFTVHSYELTVRFVYSTENQDNNQGKEFVGKIEVHAS